MENQGLGRFKFAILLFGVFVISFGVLALEISMTRIFSVMLDYHYTFLVVSLALFGLGLGGIFGQSLSSNAPPNKIFGRLAVLAVLFASSAVAFVLVAVTLPNLNFVFEALIMFIPFLIAGSLLATTYKAYVSHSSLLHFADLVGAQ